MKNAEEAAILDARISSRGEVVSVGLFNVPTVKTLTAISQAGSVATGTTSASHGFSVDDIVQISGVTPSGYNGHYRVITVPTASTYTFDATPGLGNGSAFGTVGAWVEISGGSYARVATASNDWNAAVAGAPTTKTGPKTGGSSGGVWTFPQATAQWADSSHPVVGWGLFGVTSAAFFWHGVLTTPQQVNNLDTVQFDTGNLVTAQLGDPLDPF